MPGNETPEHIHNFFEQHNSSQGRQSQVGGGGWPILNNNPFVGIQRQNGAPLSFNSKNYTSQSSDSEQGSGLQSGQTPFGSNLSQKSEIIRSQPINQQLNLNGYMHGSQGLQARSIQAEFQGDGIVSDGHNLMQRGFSMFESQQSSSPGYNSQLARSSERPEATETPVNYDFLGGQQLMRSQHPGISQPRPIQPQRISDMQLWQQHLIYKQLKEMQRQQQVMQLQQGIKQQNSLSQLSDVGRQAGSDQVPTVLSGMPINNASNNMWSNELVGGDSRLPSSSPMFFSGDVNWVQRSSLQEIPNGLMFSQDQAQAIQATEPAPQQPDKSLYGTPVASTRGSLNHQLKFPGAQGTPHDFSSMQVDIRAGVNRAEDPPMQSSAFNYFQGDQSAVPGQRYLQNGVSLAKQGFQGKNMLQSAVVQDVSSGATAGNFQQVNHVSPTFQVQEMSGMFREKAGEQVGASRGIANLDPTEEKLLFSTDDGGDQDVSFVVNSDRNTGGYLHGNPMQSNDFFSSFPTVNSGSWSALMQEAVEASSSNTGLNEEWSGLSFQKTELSSGNHSAMLHDNNRKQQAWHEQDLQNTSSLTSRPLPLFSDANASSNCHDTPNFQQAMNFSRQQTEGVSADAFPESFQQSSKEAMNKLFDHHQQKQLDEGSFQTQTQFNNIPNGVWAGRRSELPPSSTHSSEVKFNSDNLQHSWAHQQKVPLHNPSDSDNKLNSWNIQPFAPGGNTSNFYDNNDKGQHVQVNDTKRTTSIETDRDGSMWKVAGTGVSTSFPKSDGRRETVGFDTGSLMMRTDDSSNLAAVMNSNNLNLNRESNQQVLNRHQVDYGKHVANDAFFQNKIEESTTKYQNQPSGRPQTWDSSMYDTERRSGESCAHKQENSHPEDGMREGFISNNSQSGQNTEDGGSAGENSLLAGNESQPLVNGNVKSSGQSVRRSMGPCRFQFHPMGNLEMSRDPTDSPRHNLYSQSPSQSVQRLKNQEKGYVGNSLFAGHALNNAPEMGKGHLSDLQRNAKAVEEIQYRGASNSATAFDGSGSQFSENKRTGLASQNMLELLHRVDESRVGKTVDGFNFSEQNTPSGRSEADTSDGSSSHLHLSQSPFFQGFGLKLAPPTQRQSVSNHVLPSQTSLQAVNDFNQRNLDSGSRGEDQPRPPSSTSVQSLPPDDTSMKENLGDKYFPSGHESQEALYSKFQDNPLAAAAYTPRMKQSLLQQWQQQQQQQLQWQQQQDQQQRFSSASIPRPNGQYQRIRQVSVNTKQFSHPGKRHESHDVSTPDQSSETLMPSPAGRHPPSRLTSSGDTCASAASQFYPGSTGNSQPRNASSGQQIPVVETRSVAHPSATSAVSQRGGFSTMLNNVWTSVSSQQRQSGLQPQKIISNVLQSRSPSLSGRESLQAPQKPDNHNKRKGESDSSDFGTCSTNSQQFSNGEDGSMKDNASQQMPPPDGVDVDPKTGSALRGPLPEPEMKHHSDGNPAVSISSSVRLHQQDLGKGKYAQDSLIDAHKGQGSLLSIASSGAYVHSMESSEVQKQNNYSLLHQMLAMKGADSDPNGRAAKRLKGADLGMGNSKMDWAAGQKYIYGQNTVFREKDATPQNISFPSDVKVLSFSARDNEEISANTPLQVIGREVPSQNPLSCKDDLQNQYHPHGNTPTTPLAGGSERPQISPQMAPLWFEKYGNYKNGQTLTTYDGLGSFQRNEKASGPNYVFLKGSEQKDYASLQSTSPTAILSNKTVSPPSHSPLEVSNNNMILIPKKRKSATSDLLPWNKEVTQGCRRLQSISITEQEWARASNRLIDKLDEEFEMVEDGMARSRRRLILTTQLMQQILPSVPARILHADATTSYESVIYLMAKLILGDACSLTSCSRSDSRADSDSGNMILGKLNISEKERYNHFSRFVEDFIGRSKKLENEFLRLDRRTSLLDVRLECQDLERNSILNRFANFHGRAPSEGVESSSTSETASPLSFLPRHVTAHALPRNLPDGVICLSL